MQVEFIIENNQFRFKYLTPCSKEADFISGLSYLLTSFEGLWILQDLCNFQSNVLEMSEDSVMAPASLIDTLAIEQKTEYLVIAHDAYNQLLLVPVDQLLYLIHRIGLCIKGLLAPEELNEALQVDNQFIDQSISIEQLKSLPLMQNSVNNESNIQLH